MYKCKMLKINTFENTIFVYFMRYCDAQFNNNSNVI